MATKQELVAELLRLQSKLKHQPTISDIKEHSTYSVAQFSKEFKNFSTAKTEAFKEKTPRELLLQDLTDMYEKLGEMPTREQVRAYGKYPTNDYEKVFGSFTKAKQAVQFTAPNTRVYTDFLKLQGDFVITSDWHIPYYDADITNKMVSIAERMNVSKIIIAGDFFNQDAFSHYVNNNVNSFGDEAACATEVLDKLCTAFDEIYITTGNHDIRILKLLTYKLQSREFWKMISSEIGRQIKVSDYPYLRLNEKWHITHPQNFSIQPTSVARKMNHKYQMSVGVAHGHQMGVTYSPSGTDVLFDTGGMFDQDKIEYSRMCDTTHSEWQTGFSIIKNDYLYQFPKNHTDWDFWQNAAY